MATETDERADEGADVVERDAVCVDDADRTDTGRARPLSGDDRRAAIIDAVAPLVAEQGRDLTSKQMAEAAGVAEGTLFRAFGDKEAIITAAVSKLLDPAPLREAVQAIDTSLPLETKVRRIVEVLQSRFQEIFRIMALVGGERPDFPRRRPEFATIVRAVLEPDLDELNWPPERVAHIIRLVSFASAIPAMNQNTAFTTEELTSVVLYGIVGAKTGATKKEGSCS